MIGACEKKIETFDGINVNKLEVDATFTEVKYANAWMKDEIVLGILKLVLLN